MRELQKLPRPPFTACQQRKRASAASAAGQGSGALRTSLTLALQQQGEGNGSSLTLPPPLASSGLGRRQLLQLPHPVFQVLDLALRHDHERLLLAVL